MTPSFDVWNRLAQLRENITGLRLYGLLDGAQYLAQSGKRFVGQVGMCALFDGTTDADLAFAGPWLIDVEKIGGDLVDQLVALERSAHAVTWVIALQDIQGLAQILRLHLDIALPDGRTALLRFWDPRVLADLAEILDPNQRQALFGNIYEWHLINQGKRVRIGRRDA